MSKPTRAQRYRSFWLPWLVSLSIHGAAALLLALAPTASISEKSSPRIFDTRATDSSPEKEVCLRVVEPESIRSVKPIAVATPQVPTVAPPPFSPAPLPRADFRPLEGTKSPFPQGASPSAHSGQISNGGASGEGGTAFFHVAAPGKSVVYVLDRSLSMGPNDALETVKHELLASLSRLSPEVRFQIIFYNRRAELVEIDGQTGLLPASRANIQQVAIRLDDLRAEGGTEHLPALRLALSLQPDTIFFLTDAGDLPGGFVRTVTLLNRGRSSIHAIELSETRNKDRADGDANPLYQLARDNRGIYQTIYLDRGQGLASGNGAAH